MNIEKLESLKRWLNLNELTYSFHNKPIGSKDLYFNILNGDIRNNKEDKLLTSILVKSQSEDEGILRFFKQYANRLLVVNASSSFSRREMVIPDFLITESDIIDSD